MNAAATARAASKVLVIDDTELNRSLVQSVLEVHGYEVSHAMRGSEELLTSIFESPPDVIILDVMMPGINGLKMCQRLRDDARTLCVPILMITSLSDRSVRLRAIAAGANDVIIKPIDTQELFHRVRNILVAKNALDDAKATIAAMKTEEVRVRSWWMGFANRLRGPIEAIHFEIQQVKPHAPADELVRASRWKRLNELAEYANDQLNSALQAGSFNAGVQSLMLENCYLPGLLNAAVQNAQRQFPDVAITVDIPECYLTCDRSLMQRALDSLLKHMAQSSLRAFSIHVRCEPGRIELALRSDGPSAAHSRGNSGMFPVHGTDASGPQPFEDQNLSFCAYVVGLHDGKMKAESSVGANQLWISLPEITMEGKA